MVAGCDDCVFVFVSVTTGQCLGSVVTVCHSIRLVGVAGEVGEDPVRRLRVKVFFMFIGRADFK